MNINSLPIEKTGMSMRSTNALHRAGIHTVGDMLKHDEETLRSFHNIGTRTIAEILEKIEYYKQLSTTFKFEEAIKAAEGVDISENKAIIAQDFSFDGVNNTALEPISEKSCNQLLLGEYGRTITNINDLPIEKAEMSTRSTNALCRAGIHTVGDMLRHNWETLQSIHNLGEKSIVEILDKIEYYKQLKTMNKSAEIIKAADKADAFDDREIIAEYLSGNGVSIDALEMLPAKAYNHLFMNGYDKLEDVIFLTANELMLIRGMDVASADEIYKACKRFIRTMREDIGKFAGIKAEEQRKAQLSVSELLADMSYRKDVLAYVRINDVAVEDMGLSNRSVNQLLANGYKCMSDIIVLSHNELNDIAHLGSKSANEIKAKIKQYISTHEKMIRLYVNGDKNATLSESALREIIITIFDGIGFDGLSVNELISKMAFPVEVSQEMVKKILGELVANGKLEYVDFRCYRVYERFLDYALNCGGIDDREKDIIRRRFEGQTFDEIGNTFGITRERVRQILAKSANKIRKEYISETQLTLFDEDYYRYLYENYAFDCKECSEWFGVEPYVWTYLDLIGAKQGNKSLEEAVKDSANLDAGMRLRIKNYINKDRIYIDGEWVKKQRVDLEPIIAKKFCTDDVTFSEFSRLFNSFLEREGIPFDENLYYTEDVTRTRKNKLSNCRFILWKRGEKIRYYDVDGKDYEELLDTLDLGSYKNVELSTLKFFENYSELMEKYDIRDCYELHNLLRKITQGDTACSDMEFSKMPNIRFGTPDRDGDMYSIMVENAPISMNELCKLIHKEYGYDLQMIPNYLAHLGHYYHNGMFRIDHKQMDDERRAILGEALTEDFYFFDEIREIYAGLFPDADLGEINSFNLKKMGFVVNSKYVIQHHSSAEDYFSDLLNREDIFDVLPFRERYSKLQVYYQIFVEMKKNLDIIEIVPDRFMNFRRLARAGITKEMLTGFCAEVYDFAKDKSFFTIQSLKKDGFDSELFEYGFEEYFYASLLISDDRFSYQKLFSTIVFYKGKITLMLKDFVSDIIKRERKIDFYELDTLLREYYGCANIDKHDIVFKTRDAGIFYDSELQKFYSNQEEYYREIDEI